MKKMFTLIATVLFVSGAFAQNQNDNNNAYQRNDNNGYGRDRDAAYGDNRYHDDHDRNRDRGYDRDGDRWRNAARERDMQIARINREYDRKIEAVKHDWFMNRYKKERIIFSLEDRRRDEIRMAYDSFNRSCNSFNRNDHRRQ